MTTPGAVPGAEAFDESVVGVRLLIKHTVRMDEYEFLDTVAREEGCLIDDVYLKIMNTAILDAMQRRVSERARLARLRAVQDKTSKPGPKPKAKAPEKAQKAGKKAEAIAPAPRKKAAAKRARPRKATPSPQQSTPVAPVKARAPKKGRPGKAPAKPVKTAKAAKPAEIPSPAPAPPPPKPVLTRPKVKLVKAVKNAEGHKQAPRKSPAPKARPKKA